VGAGRLACGVSGPSLIAGGDERGRRQPRELAEFDAEVRLIVVTRLQGDVDEGEAAALQAVEDAAEAHETRVELGTDADLGTEAFEHARLRESGLLLERTHPPLACAGL